MKRTVWVLLAVEYMSVFLILLLTVIVGNQAINVSVENTPVNNRSRVIIDAGHGGVDGGATSCTGVLESHINLEIALRLNDLMQLLGIDTVMIRTEDISVYTEGESIAAKKYSDLKQRVKIVNNEDNAILISIHQNYFGDSRYSGAQVFYSNTPDSDRLARALQNSFVTMVNRGSHRKAKKANDIYLMQHIRCPGVLVECGFLSNPAEEELLRSKSYQLDICSVIAGVCSNYLNDRTA